MNRKKDNFVQVDFVLIFKGSVFPTSSSLSMTLLSVVSVAYCQLQTQNIKWESSDIKFINFEFASF